MPPLGPRGVLDAGRDAADLPPPPRRRGAARVHQLARGAARLRARVRPRRGRPLPGSRLGRAARWAAPRASSSPPTPATAARPCPARAVPSRWASRASRRCRCSTACTRPGTRRAGNGCSSRATEDPLRPRGRAPATSASSRRSPTTRGARRTPSDRIGLLRLVRSVDLAAPPPPRRARRGAGGHAVDRARRRCTTSRRRARSPSGSIDDRLVTGEPQPAAGADRRAALRWAAAPLTWRGDGDAPLGPRVRAAGRRLVTGLRGPEGAPAAPRGRAGGLPVAGGRRRPGARAVRGRPPGHGRPARDPVAARGGRHGLRPRALAQGGPPPSPRWRSARRRTMGIALRTLRAPPMTDEPRRHRPHRRRNGLRARGRRAAARRRAPRAPRHRPRRARALLRRPSRRDRRRAQGRPAHPRRRAAALAAGPVLPGRRPRDRRRLAQRPALGWASARRCRRTSRASACSTSAPTRATTPSCSRCAAHGDPRLRAVRVHQPGALPRGDLPHRRRLPA